MTLQQLKIIINAGEGIDTEYKSSSFELPQNTFESLCAFLNRNGGDLILGVENNGTISGVFEDSIEKIKSNFVTACNNPQIISPTYYLTPEEFKIDDKKVLYIRVPESSQVHKTNGRIFDRNEDGDFDITTNNDLVSQLYIRKQSTYSENKIYPHLKITDFKSEILKRVRKLAKIQTPNHLWNNMDDFEILKSASLWNRDYQTGEEGFTLASVLLLGKNEVISSVLPHYKTDAILRVKNKDRYDDRDDIRCNLIDSHDRLTNFITKHLPDKFFQIEGQRVNLRDKIFHEIIGNILVHREFTNAFPAKLIIEEDKVTTENFNIPHGNGQIDITNFSPFPKNPNIAKFFSQIGWVEELGSGIRNTSKYCTFYSGGKNPEFIEGDIFRTIIPVETSAFIQTHSIKSKLSVKLETTVIDVISEGVSEGVNEGVNEGVINGINEGVKKELIKLSKFINTQSGLKAEDMSQNIGKSISTIERYIRILRKINVIEFKGSPKTGGYYITEFFKDKIKKY